MLIARNLGPAELLEYDRRRLKGVLLEEGSLTAHMTIVARAMGVPVVGRLHDIRHSVEDGEQILVDGDNGSIIIRPNRPLLSGFEHRMALSQKRRAEFDAVRNPSGGHARRSAGQRDGQCRPCRGCRDSRP